MSREEAWRRFVDSFEVEVPEEAIQSELAYIKLDLRHRMQYDRLTGGDAHVSPSQELAEQEEELLQAARFEAKEPRVVQALQQQLQIGVTQEELEAEARALAARERTTVDAVRTFFGKDLAGLAPDVLRRKVIDWAVAHMGDNMA
ncbi:MAG: hypothetical protein SOV74_05325 [Coriobacteriales bacterium]|nr:hypothetical protein [Coriobacteriales bacterium]